MTPCPLCDLANWSSDSIVAFALGVSLGAAFLDMNRVSEKICPDHRPAYFRAMAAAAVQLNTVEGE